jgi:REP element-mobilizing transposase RayT
MRVARHIWPGIAYHLIWRFVDSTWYLQGEPERTKYLALLNRALSASTWRCFAFALMSNHIHMALIAGVEALESWSRRVHTPFARWINQQRGRIGPVMADRPKAIAIDRGREAHVLAYIHNNPVRAGVVARPGESSWTSHCYYVDATPPPWLAVDFACARMGITRGAEMDAWVNATSGESGELDMRAVRKRARTHGAIEVATPTAAGVVPLVRRPAAYIRPDPRFVAAIAAAAAGTSIDELASRRRSESIVAGRFAAVHCAMRLHITGADIAAALAISEGAVARIKRRDATRVQAKVVDLAWARLEVELAPAPQVKSVPGGSND